MGEKDPDKLKIPAYLRHKAIVKHDRQRLLWTAWDRKDAGVQANSPKPLGVPKKTVSTTPRSLPSTSRTTTLQRTPAYRRTRTIKTSPLLAEDTFPTPTLENPPLETPEPEPTPIKPKKLAAVGITTDYLDKINVAIIKTTTPLKISDVLLIEGDDCLFIQPLEEMQIDRKPVKRAKKGSHIGLKVSYEAEVNGNVYKLS